MTPPDHAVPPVLDPALTVAEVSEARLLRSFLPDARTDGPHVLVGPGDDCAVLSVPGGRTVITTDTQTEGQDFRAVWPNGRHTTGRDTGHKCAAQNLADVAAMGAVPSAVVVSLTMPPTTTVAWVRDFALGLTEAFDRLGAHECALVGGDLGRGRDITVTAAVTGELTGVDPVLRSGAATGGVVVHAGVAGPAAAGLAALETAAPSAWDRLDPEYVEDLVMGQLRPRPPLAAGPALAAAGATAMMDVSDGLLKDAGRLARASGVDLDLDPGALTGDVDRLRAAAGAAGCDPWEWVFTGGEDHGLLAVLPVDAQLPPGVRAIGSCAPSGSGRAMAGAGSVTIAGRHPGEWFGRHVVEGWDHFGP